MKRSCLIVVMLVAWFASTVACAVVVENLPEDGSWNHISLILSDNWQADPFQRQLKAEYDVARVEGVHWHFYTPSHPIFRFRLAHRVKAVPAIICQRADGRIVDANTDIIVGAKCAGWFPGKVYARFVARRVQRIVEAVVPSVQAAVEAKQVKGDDVPAGALFSRLRCVNGQCNRTSVDVAVQPAEEPPLPEQPAIVNVPVEAPQPPPPPPAKAEFPWFLATIAVIATGLFYYKVIDN